jgi:hypothetical protein
MTENATVSTETSTSIPVVEVLSPAEKAYFESNGSDTEGLFNSDSPKETPSDAPKTADAEPVPEADETPQADPNAIPAPDDDIVPGELMLDAEGKPQQKKEGRFVPHQALHQERLKGKELQTQLQAERSAREAAAVEAAQLKERLAIMEAALNTPEEPTPEQKAQQAAQADPYAADAPDIDPQVDIFGAFTQMQRRLAASQTQATQGVRQTQAQMAEQQLQDHYRNDAISYAQATPDFGDAYQHLANARAAELELLGMTDAAQRKQQIIQEERDIVIQALRMNKRPAELIYNMAKAKGYRKAEAAPVKTETAPATPKPAARTSVDALSAQEKAKTRAGATLSGGSGAPGDTNMPTAEALASMSEAEFDKMLNKIGVDAMRDIMGG